METRARAHKQTTCPGNHPRSTPQKPMFRTTVVTCSRTHQGMDPDGLEQMTVRLEYGCSPQKSHQVLSQKSHQRSQSTGCVLVRKAQTNPHTVRQQSDISTTGQRQMGASKVVRDGVSNDTRDRVLMSSPLGQAVR